MIYLDTSRILATFAVIFIHVAAVVVISSPIGSQNWWIANIYDSMVRWGVPVFVMISGALLLDEKKLENISIFYKKRANRILIPLLAWTIIFLFWRYLNGVFKGEIPNAKHLIKLVLLGKPYDHLWFLFMLSGLYIFTPFFLKIIKSSTTKQLIFFVCSTFIISAMNVYYDQGSKLFVNWFLYYVPYYFTGYLIHNTRIYPQKMVLTLVAITSIIATFLGCFLLSTQKGLYFYNYLSITVIPMSIAIFFLLKKLQIPILDENLTKTISSLTFGIYLIHPMILDSLNLIGISSVSFNPVISIPILAIAVFSISLFMASLISRFPYIRKII